MTFFLIVIFASSFFEELHEFFSPILLINYIISSLLICMVGLQIVAVSKFSSYLNFIHKHAGGYLQICSFEKKEKNQRLALNLAFYN